MDYIPQRVCGGVSAQRDTCLSPMCYRPKDMVTTKPGAMPSTEPRAMGRGRPIHGAKHNPVESDSYAAEDVDGDREVGRPTGANET